MVKRQIKKNIKPKSYREEKAVWYKKLEESGFEDAENKQGLLKEYSSVRFMMKHSIATQDSRKEYYDLATRFLNDFTFESEMDKIIWDYHANGMSYREIKKTLRAVFNQDLKEQIKYLVKEYERQPFDLFKKIKEIKQRTPGLGTINAIVNRLEAHMKAMYIGNPSQD